MQSDKERRLWVLTRKKTEGTITADEEKELETLEKEDSSSLAQAVHEHAESKTTLNRLITRFRRKK